MAADEAGWSGERENEGILSPSKFIEGVALGVVCGDALVLSLGCWDVAAGTGIVEGSLSLAAAVLNSLCPLILLSAGVGRRVDGGCWILGSPRHIARKVWMNDGFQIAA